MRLVPLALAVLAACAEPGLARAHSAPVRSGPFTLELLDASGAVLPTFQHRGRTYVLGALGDRYQVRVRNGSARRAEIVVSVDGRDVVDGRPAALGKRGYVVAPRGEVVVDGFRLSGAAVAAFRFSSVRDSYAGRMGDARDVGVVGAAVFLERPPPHRALADRQVRRGDAPAPEASAGAPAEAGASPAPSPAPEAAEKHSSRKAAPQDRPGLGTEFGEERESRVTEVAFARAAGAPAAVLSLRYDDRAGLLALGIDVDGRMARRDERWLRETAEPFRGSGFAAPPPGWPGR
jgi:hypothetical protein